jgi:hypothetical protein
MKVGAIRPNKQTVRAIRESPLQIAPTNKQTNRNMEDTIESKVSKTILQKPENIMIGSKTYTVAPPSIATLILASEAISKLPGVNLNSDNIASECLYIARDCAVLGEVLAILILGARGLTESKTEVKKSFFGLIKEEKQVEIDQKAVLAGEILKELSPKELNETLNRLLASMELAFFFATTASLIEVNLLRKTKETETTASGR